MQRIYITLMLAVALLASSCSTNRHTATEENEITSSTVILNINPSDNLSKLEYAKDKNGNMLYARYYDMHVLGYWFPVKEERFAYTSKGKLAVEEVYISPSTTEAGTPLNYLLSYMVNPAKPKPLQKRNKTIYTYDKTGNCTVKEYFSATGNGWNPEIRVVLKYDKNNRMTEYTQYVISNDTKSWVYHLKQMADFDDVKYIGTTQLYSWNGKEWKPAEHMSLKFDKQQRIIERITKMNDDESVFKYEYTTDGHLAVMRQHSCRMPKFDTRQTVYYDAQERPVLTETDHRLESGNIKQQFRKDFDKQGQLRLDAFSNWDAKKKRWKIERKDTLIINDSQTEIALLRYNNSSPHKWKGNSRWNFKLTNNLLQEAEHFREISTGKWEGMERYTYERSNNKITVVLYQWKNKQWQNDDKYECQIDDNGIMTAYTEYEWNGKQWQQKHAMLVAL